ncbi:MAG: hypothetical protein QOH25_406 [Acidobacteriota bacterium]|jgi:UTP-glucose-1-phosphate uridylyltransferase|nr:hypothetical protein [Acidobacteriota bacterium]
MMHDLFISYSASDGLALARLISETLEKNFLFDIFMADKEIKAVESIDSKVRDALNGSKRILVLFTANAITSEWVTSEITLALDLNKDIIVCRHQGVEKQNLPIRLLQREHIIFKDGDDLVESLNRMRWGIPVIIPAAGKSGGLYPLNMGMPKLLLPVGEKPILHHIVEKINKTPKAFSKIIILTKEFSKMIEYYAGLMKSELPVECRETLDPKLPMALKKLSLKTAFMIHYSDILIEGDFNWTHFLQHHKYYRDTSNVLGTLMASDNYKLPVGRIRTGGQQLLKEFTEKPKSIEAVGYTINMAVSIFEPEFLDKIEDNDVSLYGDSLSKAMKKGGNFCLYNHDKWRHIQTLGDWYEAQRDYYTEEYFLNDVISDEQQKRI